MSAILYAFHISKSGKARKLAPSDFDFQPKKDGFVWVHFDRRNPETPKYITDDKDTGTIATRTLLVEDSRPRTILDGDRHGRDHRHYPAYNFQNPEMDLGSGF